MCTFATSEDLRLIFEKVANWNLKRVDLHFFYMMNLVIFHTLVFDHKSYEII